ncbi:hypothetical protein D3C81_2154190 [compost metagenome]
MVSVKFVFRALSSSGLTKSLEGSVLPHPVIITSIGVTAPEEGLAAGEPEAPEDGAELLSVEPPQAVARSEVLSKAAANRVNRFFVCM